ncbi:chemosensory receptor A [Elysia marginata]|uniref:Chemosensory receptor A n=1 Tax=Elysia marginata TaxID=1093978 RepID=A0AAV4FQP3_9GAST|nr:chemosensory receptor A [Elysia marginata]
MEQEQHNLVNETNLITNSTDLDCNFLWFSSLENLYLKTLAVFPWIVLVIGVTGIVCNILIILVYTKLGFPSTIHLSYVALAVSDLGCVVASMVYAVTTMAPVSRSFETTALSDRFSQVVGGLPQMTFSRLTGLITAWISLQRCLCVTYPTRVRLMVTHKVVKVVLAFIFTIGCFPIVFVYAMIGSEWQSHVPVNDSTWALQDEKSVTMVTMVTLALIYPVVSWVCVAVCSSVLIIKLKRNARWRTRNAAGAATASIATGKNNSHVTKVVVTVAGIFLICSLPLTASLFATLALPQFSLNGALHYLYRIMVMTCVLTTQINSTVNIVIFAVSGHSFRSLLFRLLTRTCRKR